MVATVYTTNNCQPCKMTKRHLDKMGLEFSEINIVENPEALAQLKAMGYTSAPVVVSATGESWSGFNPTKLNSLKESANKA